MSSETKEHKKIKDIVYAALVQNFGVGLKEYPDCGNIADSCVITSEGTKILLEVVWTSTGNNFERDLNILLNSDAKVKILVVNPKLLKNVAVSRKFSKTQMAEAKKGTFVCDMIDGSRILDETNFISNEFLPMMRKLLDAQRTRLSTETKIKGNLKHSRRILLTRSDYQGLDHWWKGSLMDNLLLHYSEQLETKCLMKHFETGYQDELWVPLMEYKKILDKYDSPKGLALLSSLLKPELAEKMATPEEDQRLLELQKQFNDNLDEVIFGVQNEVPLKGYCDFCEKK